MFTRESILKDALQSVLGKYKYIIIDTPPSLGLLTINVLTASKSLIIPIQCEYYALEGLSQLLNTIRLIQKNLNPELNIEGIIEHWPSIMEKIHLVRPSIGAILEECKPDEFDGNNLMIKTTGGSGFSVKMVERGIPMIEKILADEIGSPIKVNFVNGGGDAQSKSKPNKKKPEIHPNDNKLFNKIVEVFDGEILR